MNVDASNLEGAELDAAVAKAEGWQTVSTSGFRPDAVAWVGGRRYSPSSDWNLSGPIIERERIELMRVVNPDAVAMWGAALWPDGADDETFETGPTALIAAMRAYVASKGKAL